MKKVFVPILLSAVILTSCATTSKKGRWINSNLVGNYAPEKPSLKDDFFQSVNYDFLSSCDQLKDGELTYAPQPEGYVAVNDQLLEMLQDSKSLSKEEDICKILYNQIIDSDTRNKLGTKPAMEIISRIQSVSTVKEYFQLALAEDMPTVLPLTWVLYSTYFLNSNVYTPTIEPEFVFGNSFQYLDQESEVAKKTFVTTQDFYKKLLLKCGWAEAEANQFIQEAFAFEKSYAEKSDVNNNSSFTKDYFNNTFPNIPVYEILENKGGNYQNVSVMNISAMIEMSNCFSDENLESIKKISILKFLNYYSKYLDMECLELALKTRNALNNIEVYPTQNDIDISLMESLITPLSQAWLKRYFPENTKTEVENIVDEIIQDYTIILDNSDWISDRTKLQAKDKLYSIVHNVGYGKMDDYTSLQLSTASTDGALLKNVITATKFSEKLQLAYTSELNEKNRWELPLTPLTINAFYQGNFNSINICAGILNNNCYKSDWSIEKKLANIGFLIGHEITHSFDINGGTTDKDGNQIMWWDALDYQTLVEKSQKVGTRVSSVDTTTTGAQNSQYWGEVTADQGAMNVVLMIAKQYPDFNYDEFFTEFAKSWAILIEPSYVTWLNQYSTHPMSYVRVNSTLQLFDEFYETYDIQEGDGMYLPPEERFHVW